MRVVKTLNVIKFLLNIVKYGFYCQFNSNLGLEVNRYMYKIRKILFCKIKSLNLYFHGNSVYIQVLRIFYTKYRLGGV